MKDYQLVTIESSDNKSVLKKAAQPVAFPLSEEQLEMIHFMKKHVVEIEGVGLAAPQIGVSEQIIVVYISADVQGFRKHAHETMEPTIFINPDYKPDEGAQLVADWEGCFSVETVTGKVPRFDKIVYTALDEQGQAIEAKAQGFTARVLQHEIDHIQGTLIIDRLTKDTVHGHPSDMALLRIQDMSTNEKALMRKMIEEAIERGEPGERYRDLLKLLDTDQSK